MTDKTTAERWYMLNKDGMAMLCADKADAEQEAIDAQAAWPGMGPHRAVQLVEAGASLPLPGAQDALEPLPAAVPVAQDEWKVRDYLAATLKCWHRLTGEEATELVAMTQRLAGLYAAPQPALSAGWVSVDERLPEPNVEVLCAGRGWGNSFVTACYYDDERREWYPINTHWTDATGCAQYPTHWMPMPVEPSMDGESNG